MPHFRNKLAGDPGKFPITILFTIRALYSLTRKAWTPTRWQRCRQIWSISCVWGWTIGNISVGPGAEKEKKLEKERGKTDRKQTKNKSLLLWPASLPFLPQLKKGINSNRSELFTTCTHHTHHMSAWQRPIILQVLHERWLSYPLFCSPSVVLPVTSRTPSTCAVGCGDFSLRACSPGFSNWKHFFW